MYRLVTTLVYLALFCGDLAGQVVLMDQTGGQQGASIVAQDFESAYETYTSFAAEDVIRAQWRAVVFGLYSAVRGIPKPFWLTNTRCGNRHFYTQR